MNWELSSSGPPPTVHFGYGQMLRQNRDGNWQVGGEAGWHVLSQGDDYWRTVVLLEKPFSEVKATFETIGCAFPLECVVRAGLALSKNWVELALRWVPDLDEVQRRPLIPLVTQVINDPRIDQALRQKMRKFVRRPY